MWVAEVNGRSVGFVQDYRIGDYPDYALLAPDPDAIGLDYAIGEPEWVGRGLGVPILWAWMLNARQRLPEATRLLRGAGPPQRSEPARPRQGRLRPRAVVRRRRSRTVGVDTVVGCTLDVDACWPETRPAGP